MLGQALGLKNEEFDALQGDYRASPLFTEKEKAVLAWSEAMTHNTAKHDTAAWHELRRLFNEADGTQIGNDLTGTLQPYQNRRFSDIIALVGGPATIDNVRVRFINPTDGAALVGLCTVQENRYLGADFRTVSIR